MSLMDTANEVVSIDLGASLVKLIVTDKKGAVVRAVVVPNRLGFSIPQETVQIERLKDLINSIFKEHNLPKRGARLTLPESAVVTQVVSVPHLTDAELASSIAWQAEQYIPIPKEELELEYQVLYRPDKQNEQVENMRVLLIGIRRNLLNNFLAAFRGAGVEATLLETETVSLLRDLALPVNSPVTMVANFGASGMTVSVVRNGELTMAVNHGDGGDLMTKALMNTFNLPSDKAEGYKIAYGLQRGVFEEKIYNALLPIANIFLTDIKNSMAFFSTLDSLSVIERLIIAGGPAQMPGLMEFLMENLNLEIMPAAPFYGLEGNLPVDNLLLYPVVAGLAKKKSD